MSKPKVLISDALSPAAVQIFKDRGVDVDFQPNLGKDKDKLAGTMSWPDQKDAKLKDVKLKDGELTFSAEREIMDMKLTVEYKLKIDGDKFKGKAAVDVGGEKREIDIEGKREKKDK